MIRLQASLTLRSHATLISEIIGCPDVLYVMTSFVNGAGLPDTIDEELIDAVPVALGDAGLLGGRATPNDALLVLIRLKEVRHLARVEDVVDVLKEFLHHYLQPSRRSSALAARWGTLTHTLTHTR